MFNTFINCISNRYICTQKLLKEGNVLFNDALNTFYLHIVKDHSDSERGNLLPPHRLLFPISSKGSSNRQDNTYHGLCYTSRGSLAGTRNSSMGPPHERSIRRPIAPWANALTTQLHLAPLYGQRQNLMVALHQIKWLSGQNLWCTVKVIWSKCDEGCDWCIYVTVVTCADTLTFTLCSQ